LLFAATFLSGAGGILGFFVGLGAGLSENPRDAWAFWVLGALSGAGAILCDRARDRD
jgi:hypothetical protein